MKKQYAALPYRISKHKTEILLITTRRKRKWSVPKGWPMKGRSPRQAAAVEAFQEAGVIGRVSPRRVGRFKYSKASGTKIIQFDVDVFPLAVQGKLHRWPEKAERKRRWFAAEDAMHRVQKKGLRRVIGDLVAGRLGNFRSGSTIDPD